MSQAMAPHSWLHPTCVMLFKEAAIASKLERTAPATRMSTIPVAIAVQCGGNCIEATEANPQDPSSYQQVYRLMIDENLLEPYLPHTYDAVSQKADRHIYTHQSTPESGRWIQAPRPVPKQSRPLPKELLASQPSRSKEGRLSSRLGTSFAGASR